MDSDGNLAKDMWKQTAPLLDRDNLSSSDKARLIMLYLLTQPKMSDTDRRSMLDHAKLNPKDMESVKQLMNMTGVIIKLVLGGIDSLFTCLFRMNR